MKKILYNIKNINYLDQKIFAAFTLSKKQIILKNSSKPMSSAIASIFLTKYWYQYDSKLLTKRLQTLNCKQLLIVDIYPYVKKEGPGAYLHEDFIFNPKLPLSIENPSYKILETSIYSFFSSPEKSIHTLLSGESSIPGEKFNIIFIFNGLPWSLILTCFYLIDTVVSFGSNTKRGLLSPVHHRLSQFITCIEGFENNKSIINSFENYSYLAARPMFNLIDLKQSSKDYTQWLIKFFTDLEDYIKITIRDNYVGRDYEYDFRKDEFAKIKIDYDDFLINYGYALDPSNTHINTAEDIIKNNKEQINNNDNNKSSNSDSLTTPNHSIPTNPPQLYKQKHTNLSNSFILGSKREFNSFSIFKNIFIPHYYVEIKKIHNFYLF